MILAATAIVVGVAGAWLAWSWLRSGAYRREDEGGPLPDHRWVLAVVPVATLALAWAQRDEPWAAALAVSLLGPTGAALVAVDRDVHRLPNAITLRAVPVVAGLLTLAAATSGRWDDLRRAAIALVLVGGAFVVLSLVLGARGIGMGDAKLVLSLAPQLAWHSWGTVLAGVYGAFLAGGLVALGLMVTRRADRGSHLAFGPYLVGAAAVALLLA